MLPYVCVCECVEWVFFVCTLTLLSMCAVLSYAITQSYSHTLPLNTHTHTHTLRVRNHRPARSQAGRGKTYGVRELGHGKKNQEGVRLGLWYVLVCVSVFVYTCVYVSVCVYMYECLCVWRMGLTRPYI
jgi:hypothetical protein